MGAELAVPPELAQQPPTVLAQARAMVVASAEDYQAAGGFLKQIKAATKTVVDFFKPLKQSADEHKRSILDAERKHAGPLAEAEGIVKRAMTTYETRVKQEAEAERRRLQAEADERARRDKAALEKIAAAAKKPETQERYREQAAAVIAPVIAVEAPAPKVAGISTRQVWHARVVDPLKVPREFLMIDEKKLEQYARAMKEGAAVPGVEFYFESVMAASGR